MADQISGEAFQSLLSTSDPRAATVCAARNSGRLPGGEVTLELTIRGANEDDAEAVSRVILTALRQTNAKDYSQDIIARVERSFSPSAVLAFLSTRRVYVAVVRGRIVGTASLDGSIVRSVFVDPELQGRGIGKRLMAEVEEAAHAGGVTALTVPSSVTAEAFYAGLGFKAVRDSYYGDDAPSSWSAR